MRTRRGIAIISVLLIMLAVFTLGLGALFLSRLNLRMSENVRSNSIVRYNTESGLDASMIALEEYYVTNGEFPPGNTPPLILSSLSLVAQGPDPAFTVFDYNRVSTDVAMLKARSILANGAEHVAELLVGIELDSNPSGGGAPFGLRSEGVVTVNGSSSYIDASIHGNEGFDIKGNIGDDFYICVDGLDADEDPDRDPVTGLCTNTVAIPLADAPVSGSPGATTCKPDSLCTGGVPNTLIDPIDVNPDYYGRRDGIIDELSQAVVDGGGSIQSIAFLDSNGDAMHCDYVTNLAITYTDLSSCVSTLQQGSDIDTPTMCLEYDSAMSIPAGAIMSDFNIVAQGNIDFAGSVTINNATLISMTGGVFDDTLTGPGNNVDATTDSSRIFSELSVGIHGTNSNFTGITTIASAGDITVNGGAEAVIVDGEATVGLALIAEGDITVDGSSQWYLGAMAGGTFVQNGTSFILQRFSQ